MLNFYASIQTSQTTMFDYQLKTYKCSEDKQPEPNSFKPDEATTSQEQKICLQL